MMGDGPRTRLRRLACSRRASNTDPPVNMGFFLIQSRIDLDLLGKPTFDLFVKREGGSVKIERMCVCVEGN